MSSFGFFSIDDNINIKTDNGKVIDTFYSKKIKPGTIIRIENIKYLVQETTQMLCGECKDYNNEVTWNHDTGEVTFVIDDTNNQKFINITITNEDLRSRWDITSNMNCVVYEICAYKAKREIFTNKEKLIHINLDPLNIGYCVE